MRPDIVTEWLEDGSNRCVGSVGAVVEVHVTRQKNHRHRICNLIINRLIVTKNSS